MPPRKKRSSPSRFASYARCSTDDQAEGDFTTIEVQLGLNRRHIETLGGVLVNEYKDDGKTGTSLERPGWKRLLAAARSGMIDGVCVTYMSRLGRGDIFTIAEYLLRENGVAVELVKEKFTDDLVGYIGQSMTRVMDGIYPKMVAQWTRTKMEAMVERGYHCGGNTPFGFKTIEATDADGFSKPGKPPPRRLMPNDETASFALRAFEMASTGTGLKEIARYLTATGDRIWNATTVKNLLRMETYLGIQVFGAWRNESAHPAIVTREMWDKVQAHLERRDTTMYSRKQPDDYAYLLIGLVWCPHCDVAYTCNSAHGRNGRVHYYSCQNANKGGQCPVVRVNADKLHAAVFDVIRKATARSGAIHDLLADYVRARKAAPAAVEKDSSRGPIAKRLQFVRVQIGNYTRAIGDGRALDALLPALEKALDDERRLVAELQRIDGEKNGKPPKPPTLTEMQEGWREFVGRWDYMSPELKRAGMQALVRRVVVKTKELADVELEVLPHVASSSVRISDGSGSGGWT